MGSTDGTVTWKNTGAQIAWNLLPGGTTVDGSVTWTNVTNHASRVRHHWTADEEKLLGTLPDQEVAELLSRTVISVELHRRRLGIPRAKPGASSGAEKRKIAANV